MLSLVRYATLHTQHATSAEDLSITLEFAHRLFRTAGNFLLADVLPCDLAFLVPPILLLLVKHQSLLLKHDHWNHRNFRGRKNFRHWHSRTFFCYKFLYIESGDACTGIRAWFLYANEFPTFSQKYEINKIKSSSKISAYTVYMLAKNFQWNCLLTSNKADHRLN